MAGSRVAMAVATAPIRPLAWKPPYAVGVVLKKQKDQKKNPTTTTTTTTTTTKSLPVPCA